MQKHDEPGGPASAIAGVRYAATLLAGGEGGAQVRALPLLPMAWACRVLQRWVLPTATLAKERGGAVAVEFSQSNNRR